MRYGKWLEKERLKEGRLKEGRIKEGRLKGWLLKRQKGSLIVESSFVIPMVLMCLLLLILVNFYLHDLIVLQSLTQEAACADQEEEKLMEYLNAQAKEWTLIAGQTSFYKEENLIRRKYGYRTRIKLPVLSFFERKEGTILSMEGCSGAKNWNTSHILRLIEEKGE